MSAAQLDRLSYFALLRESQGAVRSRNLNRQSRHGNGCRDQFLAVCGVNGTDSTVPFLKLSEFCGLPLPGGFILSGVDSVPGPLIDPIGRPALAKTIIQGRDIRITLDQAQTPLEQSISIYHEAIEGLTVAFAKPPVSVIEFCEADFEREAKAAQERFGFASPVNVLTFLRTYDFR